MALSKEITNLSTLTVLNWNIFLINFYSRGKNMSKLFDPSFIAQVKHIWKWNNVRYYLTTDKRLNIVHTEQPH